MSALVGLTQAEIDRSKLLPRIQVLQTQASKFQVSSNNVLIGQSLTNVPTSGVTGAVCLGGGNKTGLVSNELVLGHNCAPAGVAGRISFGNACEAVHGSFAAPAANPQAYLKIKHNGTLYYVPMYTTVPS